MAQSDSHVRIGRAAKMLGVTVDTIRRWADDDRLRTVRSAGGQPLVPIEEVTRLIGERRRASTDRPRTPTDRPRTPLTPGSAATTWA